MSKTIAVIKKALSITLMLTLGSSYGLITSTAFAQISPQLVGHLSSNGQVFLNDVNAVSGATVFDGNKIKTGSHSSATISLGKSGQVDLEPEGELTLRLTAGGIGGQLRAGRATISAPAGITVNIATADGVAVADGKQATVLTVDTTSGNTRVASIRNVATVTAGNRVETVAAGQEVSVGAQANKKGSPCECVDRNGNKIGDGTYNDKGVCECNSRAATGAVVGGGGLSAGALAALLIVGIGGAVGGIIAATQGDRLSSSGVLVLSNFRS